MKNEKKYIKNILIQITNLYPNLNEIQITKLFHIIYYSIQIKNHNFNIINSILLCKILNIF